MANDTNASLESSILLTIKKLLGSPTDYTAFDVDILTHINSVFSILQQMGIGPEEGFFITGEGEKWDDYISIIDKNKTNSIKTYIYQKVRYVFDPPSNGNLLESLSNSIKELEYRLYTAKGGY